MGGFGSGGFGSGGFGGGGAPAPELVQVDYCPPAQFDVGANVGDFATGLYVLVRTPIRDNDDNGRTIPVVPTRTLIQACVVPTPPDQLIYDKQGNYSKDQITIYSNDRIEVSTEDQEPDRIEVNGKTYTVVFSRNWCAGGFYESIAVGFV